MKKIFVTLVVFVLMIGWGLSIGVGFKGFTAPNIKSSSFQEVVLNGPDDQT